MDIAVILVLLLILLAFVIVTGLLAARKGYSPLLWALTGIVGLLLLAFLPFTTGPRADATSADGVRRVGNTIGGVLTGLGVVMGIVQLLAA